MISSLQNFQDLKNRSMMMPQLPVRQPADSSRNGKEDREEVSGEAHCFVDKTAVEVNVGV